MSKPLSPALQKLLAEFGRKLPEKFDEIRALHAAAAASGEIEDYYTAVHRLAGSSGSYGFRPVSEACRVLDRYLSDVRAGEKRFDPAEAEQLLGPIAEAITAAADSP